jgi:hypothetical protein
VDASTLTFDADAGRRATGRTRWVAPVAAPSRCDRALVGMMEGAASAAM